VNKELPELPKRNRVPITPPQDGRVLRGLTEVQIARIVDAASRMVGDLGPIVQDVVTIWRIRAEAGADVARIDASTRQIVAAARAEIDRLAQVESHTRSRGQVVVDVIKAFTALIETVPELDTASRHGLVDSLRWLVEAAVKG
jgi:hypothetical protein